MKNNSADGPLKSMSSPGVDFHTERSPIIPQYTLKMASHLARQYAPRCTIIPQQGLTTIIPPSSTTTSDTPANASNTSRQIPHINTSNPASRGVHEASSERSLKQNSVPQMRPHRPQSSECNLKLRPHERPSHSFDLLPARSQPSLRTAVASHA